MEDGGRRTRAWRPRTLAFPLMTLALFTLGLLNTPAANASQADTLGYMRYPDLHGTRVVLSSSGDLWLADTKGGEATRITAHEGDERFPKFSPDGKWIAFTGQYYGNDDVFVVPAEGGEPRQLTFHGAADWVIGWDDQGRVLFSSDRVPPYRARELYAVDVNGGFPEKLPYFRGAWLAQEPGGNRVALINNNMAFHIWNQYKGGEAEKIWIGDPGVPEFKRVSYYRGNESFPMWATNGRIYFVMDSTGRENLWSMMPDGSTLRQETYLEDDDVRWPSLDGHTIIFQMGTSLATFDLDTREITALHILVPTDRYVAMTRYVDPQDYLRSWSLSDDGKRLLVEARGELFTLPVKGNGIIRQWTHSSGSREKAPRFLPKGDGTVVAITDASNEDRLVRFKGPAAEAEPIEASAKDDWKNDFRISPDGRWLALSTGEQVLYLVDMKNGKRSEIAEGGWEFYEYTWSPDSRYLAYVSVVGEGDRSYLYVYDTETGENHELSDERFNTYAPAWDPQGRFLYCASDRNFNAYQDYARGLFLYSNQSTLVLIRLRSDVPDPFIARGDEAGSGIPPAPWMDSSKDDKKDKGDKDDKDDDEIKPLNIEWEGILDRVSPIPETPGIYSNLQAAGDKLYYVSGSQSGMMGHDGNGPGGSSLRVYDLGKRESSEVLGKVNGYEISEDGSTIVARSGNSWYWGDAGSGSINQDGDHTVSTAGWSVEVTPSQEWKQILRETWRQQREFFYDPGMNTVDWDAVYAKWAPRIDRMTTRDDLLDILREVQAELHSGHAYVWGGDMPEPKKAPIGYLGVDMRPDPHSGGYVITRMYQAEPGTDGGGAPLTYADPKAGKGTYLLAIDGRKVDASKNIYRLLQNKAGQEVALTLNEKPSFEGAREVIVKTLRSEHDLRFWAWTKQNREYVWNKSDGKVGYFYLPDMGGAGLREFGRDYYPQRDKDGMIVDDRYNGGGNVSELIMKEMTTPIFAQQASRYSAIETKPHGAFHGHIAVLINEATASDGESMAYATKALGFGTLIGERTWGGWVWIWPRRPNVDNGGVSVPEFGGWGMNGDWIVEGTGVSPEVKVVNDPASEMQGVDPQLDYAIDHLLKQIAEHPRTLPPKPKEGLYEEKADGTRK